MIAKILFRGFTFICSLLILLVLTSFSAIFLGLVADPEEGCVELGGKRWVDFLTDSAVRGLKNMFDKET